MVTQHIAPRPSLRRRAEAGERANRQVAKAAKGVKLVKGGVERSDFIDGVVNSPSLSRLGEGRAAAGSVAVSVQR